MVYNGLTKGEMILSKVASFAGIGIRDIAAGLMFLILAYSCFKFFQLAKEKGNPQAKVRVAIYTLCGIAIGLSSITLGFDGLTGNSIIRNFQGSNFMARN